MCSLRTAVAAHPAITFILVVTPSAAQSRVHASTDRRDRSPDRQHRQDGRDRTPPPPMHSSRRSQSSTSRGNTASGAGALLPYVACLKDVPRALQLPARPGSDPREAGKHYLRNYVARWADYQRSDGHCGAGWALFDFGARSFGGADAVLVSPYAHYIACDLFAYNDARVIQMLDRHNQNGVRAVYMQGVRGRVPTIDAIATVMQNTWGLPIQALRVLMASPNCGTISSASTRGRYPPLARDPTNDFAPISHRAREDDQTRMGITRLVENLYRLRLRTSDSPLFTALLEQPRSGCASGLRDIRAALEFGHGLRIMSTTVSSHGCFSLRSPRTFTASVLSVRSTLCAEPPPRVSGCDQMGDTSAASSARMTRHKFGSLTTMSVVRNCQLRKFSALCHLRWRLKTAWQGMPQCFVSLYGHWYSRRSRSKYYRCRQETRIHLGRY